MNFALFAFFTAKAARIQHHTAQRNSLCRFVLLKNKAAIHVIIWVFIYFVFLYFSFFFSSALGLV
jgi:hypothetical protein